ncbi:MAG: hypothetical protein ACI9LM_004157 [Alteromonadaceae bacterium]|jgi:hypothetical protein
MDQSNFKFCDIICSITEKVAGIKLMATLHGNRMNAPTIKIEVRVLFRHTQYQVRLYSVSL